MDKIRLITQALNVAYCKSITSQRAVIFKIIWEQRLWETRGGKELCFFLGICILTDWEINLAFKAKNYLSSAVC